MLFDIPEFSQSFLSHLVEFILIVADGLDIRVQLLFNYIFEFGGVVAPAVFLLHRVVGPVVGFPALLGERFGAPVALRMLDDLPLFADSGGHPIAILHDVLDSDGLTVDALVFEERRAAAGSLIRASEVEDGASEI